MLRKVGRPKKKLAVGRPRVQSLVAGTEFDKRITHGGTSPKAVLPHRNRVEGKLYKLIFTLEPHLTRTDALLVQQLARTLAIQDMYWAYFQENSEKWIESSAHKAFYTGQKNILRACGELGLSTSSKIKLGIDYSRLRESALDKYRKPETVEGEAEEAE